MSRRRTSLGLLLLLPLTSACGSDALGPIDSRTISLTINSMNASDVQEAGFIEKDENISTESGNPWGEFVRDSEGVCGGDPAGFEVLAASIALDRAGSSGVAALDDVVTGAATVFFASTRGNDASAVRADIGSTTTATGVGPVSLAVSGGRGRLVSLHERLLGGDFHVGLRAETNRDRDDSFSMDVIVSFQARAHC